MCGEVEQNWMENQENVVEMMLAYMEWSGVELKGSTKENNKWWSKKTVWHFTPVAAPDFMVLVKKLCVRTTPATSHSNHSYYNVSTNISMFYAR